MTASRSQMMSSALRSRMESTPLRWPVKSLRRSLAARRSHITWTRRPVSTLLLMLIEAGGDPSVFCYRIGVGILSTGRECFLAPVPKFAEFAKMATLTAMTLAARRPQKTRNRVACSNLFSTFSARSTILKD
jgi:hypothetical protein